MGKLLAVCVQKKNVYLKSDFSKFVSIRLIKVEVWLSVFISVF